SRGILLDTLENLGMAIPSGLNDIYGSRPVLVHLATLEGLRGRRDSLCGGRDGVGGSHGGGRSLELLDALQAVLAPLDPGLDADVLDLDDGVPAQGLHRR